MSLEELKQWFTIKHILDMLAEYRSFGVIPGIVLPMAEAFLPFLPLFVFIMANAAAFGLWKGFLISWIGTSVGSLLVFLLVRKIGRQRFFSFLHRHPTIRRMMHWVERRGFGPLFLLLCFPFTPSAAVNVVAGLSGIAMQQYMLAVLFGKMVMVFMISFIGYDVVALVRQPLRTVFVAVAIFLLWYIGKKVEQRFALHDGK
ncbi:MULTISPECIES: TVP38/TMEM64 family protein [Anoxybacillus]|uniref:TVP38/TMEM64 family membrane protein n=1 Tax=Anoxybacillus pushchinoensis TaxID=150248 RepID=A0A1I0TH50_9BACL|nr:MULTISPECIES: TVP38/TMEM64 family protein [Anoxybacillus]MBE2913472.1 TVP38/TMEM64 family protein [Anoxybacillus flavithermus]MBE2940207.1 TVP38/TMEM64 family protein [Anoxybacillus flavithermus]MBE2942806.1 TVP38/TMEM64 family protein [Anoxybacillus flavithermus]MBE2951325.1 TVP38/TMEM64 family protein [Anoxybacillus flavithermus]MBE2953947.1 TVP38/TMEM64 family protein [Anoxybacillus flavithermus]